jgi:hypothetical protein
MVSHTPYTTIYFIANLPAYALDDMCNRACAKGRMRYAPTEMAFDVNNRHFVVYPDLRKGVLHTPNIIYPQPKCIILPYFCINPSASACIALLYKF